MKLTDVELSPEGLLEVFVRYFNHAIIDSDDPELKKEEAHIIWFSYIAGNARALVFTTRRDQMYYELTYDSIEDRLYVDGYLKVRHDWFGRKEIKND